MESMGAEGIPIPTARATEGLPRLRCVRAPPDAGRDRQACQTAAQLLVGGCDHLDERGKERERQRERERQSEGTSKRSVNEWANECECVNG